MSKESYTNQNFYTIQELQDFTNNFTDLTVTNLTKFIEIKTTNKYTIVPVEFVKDINKQFLNHEILIFKFVKLTNDIWEELKLDNEKVVKKHKKILGKFEIVNGE